MKSIDLDRLKATVEGAIENLIVLDTIDSTHLMARRILEQVDEDGAPLRPTLVVATSQTGGQGRGANTWESPTGGLYVNWLSGNLSTALVPMLPMIAATAAHAALTGVGIDEVRIKWPNDLLIGDKKVAGLLIHCRHTEQVLATIGFGVNIACTPRIAGAPPIHPPTCILDALPDVEATESACRVLMNFVAQLESGLEDPQSSVRSWRKNLLHREGDTIAVRVASGDLIRGLFEGVTEEGHVRISTEDGERTLSSGDIIED